MAMGALDVEVSALFPTADDLPTFLTVPFFDNLSEVLAQVGFDSFVADRRRSSDPPRLSRPSMPLGGQGAR